MGMKKPRRCRRMTVRKKWEIDFNKKYQVCHRRPQNSQAKKEIRNFSTVIFSLKSIYSEKASKIWPKLPYNLGELRRKKT